MGLFLVLWFIYPAVLQMPLGVLRKPVGIFSKLNLRAIDIYCLMNYIL